MDKAFIEIRIESDSLPVHFTGSEFDHVVAPQNFGIFIVDRRGGTQDRFRGRVFFPELRNGLRVRTERIERLAEKLFDIENIRILFDDVQNGILQIDECTEIPRFSAVNDVLKLSTAFFVFGQGEIPIPSCACRCTVRRTESAIRDRNNGS